MKTLISFGFLLLLLTMGHVRGDPPECFAPDAEDVEMLLENVSGQGPVS